MKNRANGNVEVVVGVRNGGSFRAIMEPFKEPRSNVSRYAIKEVSFYKTGINDLGATELISHALVSRDEFTKFMAEVLEVSKEQIK